MSALARALLDDLGPDELAALADRLAPFMRPSTIVDDGWLDTKAAAAHLGVSVHAIHRLTRERKIPFNQAGAGAKCWFRRSDLDAWRQGAVAQ
jgi:excisionase family DNA binding protein